MALLWDGKHKFEAGDVVRIREGHPFGGIECVITALFDRQFQVTSKGLPSDGLSHVAGRMWLWGEDLELVISHRTSVPAIFEEED